MSAVFQGYGVTVERDDGMLDGEPWTSQPLNSFIVALMVAHECIALYPDSRVAVGDYGTGRTVFDSSIEYLVRIPSKGIYRIVRKKEEKK